MHTRFGTVRGRRLDEGGTVFLGLPYALYDGRWKPPRPLPDDYKYPKEEFSTLAPQSAQPALWVLPMSVATPQAILGPPEQGFAEDCLTLDIYIPPRAAWTSNLPVSVFIHGGYLNTGSPACHMNEPSKLVGSDEARIWVCITYRLAVFGFLAASEPRLEGNWGFQDQWQALLWVQSHISAFGGDPTNVTLLGQSAGAHSTQHHLHRASRLPDHQPIPFQHAVMHSNGIAVPCKSLQEAQVQFDALCAQLKLDHRSSDIMDRLRSLSTRNLVDAVQSLGGKAAFRGVTDGNIVAEDMLEWQTSGRLAESLARKGFKTLTIGETVDEDLGGVCPSFDFLQNVMNSVYGRKAGKIVVERAGVHAQSSTEDLSKANRAILSDMQIHLGSRKLVKALWRQPKIEIIRYMMAWAPPAAIAAVSRGGVAHGTDLAVWFARDEYMTPEEAEIARRWRAAVRSGKRAPSERHHLVLTRSGDIVVEEDHRWATMDELDRLLND